MKMSKFNFPFGVTVIMINLSLEISYINSIKGHNLILSVNYKTDGALFNF